MVNANIIAASIRMRFLAFVLSIRVDAHPGISLFIEILDKGVNLCF
jgi:hypothetical protein